MLETDSSMLLTEESPKLTERPLTELGLSTMISREKLSQLRRLFLPTQDSSILQCKISKLPLKLLNKPKFKLKSTD
jgi:hypothetical protein